MFDILSITGVVFVLIGIGYLAVRLGVFSAEETRTLGKFVVNLALPALIFRAVSSRPLGEITNTGYLGAVLFGSLAVFAAGYLWSRRVAGASAQTSTFRAMGMSCANSGFVGYPVLLMALPEVASTALAMNMIVENLVMIPLVIVMAEHARGSGQSGKSPAAEIARRLAQSPIVIALALAILVSVTGLPVPSLIARPVEVLAASSAALSLVAIGGTVAALPFGRLRKTPISVVVGKLILHPVAVAIGLAIMAAIGRGTGDDRLAAAAILLAAMPVMAIYPILAQRFGEEGDAAPAMFVMTVASFVTLSVALAIILP